MKNTKKLNLTETAVNYATVKYIEEDKGNIDIKTNDDRDKKLHELVKFKLQTFTDKEGKPVINIKKGTEIETLKKVLIKYNGMYWHLVKDVTSKEIYLYNPDTKIYTSDATEIKSFLYCGLNKHGISDYNELYKTLGIIKGIPVKQFADSKHILLCNNYLIDTTQEYDKKIPFDEVDERYLLRQNNIINRDYKGKNIIEPVKKLKDGTEWKLSQWIKETVSNNNGDIEKMFWQVLGLSTIPTVSMCYMFYSKELNTGKGTAQTFIKSYIGNPALVGSVGLHQFDDDRSLHGLIGKKVILADELPKNTYLKTDNFKALIGGEGCSVKKLYRDEPLLIKENFVMIQTGNSVPNANNPDMFQPKRFRVIPFTKSFSDKKDKPEIKNELLRDKEVLDWAFTTIINNNYHRLTRVDLVDSTESQLVRKDIFENTNTVAQWLSEYEFDKAHYNLNEFYSLYKDSNHFNHNIKQGGFKNEVLEAIRLNDYDWEFSDNNKIPNRFFNTGESSRSRGFYNDKILQQNLKREIKVKEKADRKQFGKYTEEIKRLKDRLRKSEKS